MFLELWLHAKNWVKVCFLRQDFVLEPAPAPPSPQKKEEVGNAMAYELKTLVCKTPFDKTFDLVYTATKPGSCPSSEHKSPVAH